MVDAAAEKLKILIVEDEALVAILLEDILIELGHDIIGVAGRVDAALELVGRAEIDCAILDLNLNGQRTYVIAEALAARGVPFVFVTGYGAAGVDDAWKARPILQKPFEQHQLAALIAEATRAS